MFLEMEVIEVDEVLGSLFGLLPDGVILYDRGGRSVAVNTAARTLLGLAADRAPGDHYLEQIAVGDRTQLESAVAAALAGGSQRFESSLVARDDEVMRVEYETFAATHEGVSCGFFLLMRDAVALREAGERIRQLYLVAAARGQTVGGQIDRTLSLGLRIFRLRFRVRHAVRGRRDRDRTRRRGGMGLARGTAVPERTLDDQARRRCAGAAGNSRSQ